MESMTNLRGKSTGASCISLETDGGRNEEEDSKPSLVTSNTLVASSLDQAVVQEEAPGQIPSGWKVHFSI
jgi:hypothetical protein